MNVHFFIPSCNEIYTAPLIYPKFCLTIKPLDYKCLHWLAKLILLKRSYLVRD